VTKARLALAALLSAVMLNQTAAMGIRSLVALPLEKGGMVGRLLGEHNADEDLTVLTGNLAYGISAKQTLFFGLPYRVSSGPGDRTGDLDALYRHIVWQSDHADGTSRLGLLGGLVVPTDSDRDPRLQAGAVATFYRNRHEWDLDAIWIDGLGNEKDRARYDIAWQYRLSPARYPQWGVGNEWDIDLELGGRWEEGNTMIHQATLGLQSIHKRWVIEGAVVQDLNSRHDTRYILSTRFHF
jgi:hypothetical protein